ncbi:hypothetical protein KKA53_03870 [Candidatus Dependentiae bacterium]|nr:hypothetical protein [Candidatus Dependentiae bacterium]
MRRFVHGLLAALILIGSVSAKTYTNKTFLMPRSHNMNLAMEYTTWHKQMALIDDDKFGGTVQATAFYEDSNNKKELGQYFGVCNYDNGSSTDDFISVVPQWDPIPHPKHIAAPFVLHTPNFATIASGLTLSDKLTWRPSRESYGVRLDYHQKLDKVLKGLFFKVSAPIVHAKTSMGYTSSCCNTSCATTCETSCSTGCDTTSRAYCNKQALEVSGALTGAEKSLADYLSGCVTNDDATAKQAALCRMKIHNGNSETGIADIDLMLGYNFCYKPTKHVGVNIGLTIPTGNTPNSEHVWEAVVGNGGHWALGAGLDAAFQIWKDKDKSLDILMAFNYRYLFSSTELRTVGFNWPAGLVNGGYNVNWAGRPAMYGHYWLGAKLGSTTTTPMANFLTQNVKVTPGSHFDGIVQFAFNYDNWTFDLGYNLFAKEKEDVDLKCNSCEDACSTACDTGCSDACCPVITWEDNTYAVAKNTWDTSGAFAAANAYLATADWINRTDLCTDPCTNPSVVTHKIYGGFGYAFKDWDYPLILGLGGSYEFATDNDCLEAWSLWAKVGLTF